MAHSQSPELTQDPSRVVRARREAGLAQNELAARVGISAAHMCRIEKGRCGASMRVLRRVAEATGRDVAELLPAAPEGTA